MSLNYTNCHLSDSKETKERKGNNQNRAQNNILCNIGFSMQFAPMIFFFFLNEMKDS